MKKRRRYIQYDYEAAFSDRIDEMERGFLDAVLPGKAPAWTYATKEIRSGDQLEVEIYPEFTAAQKGRIPEAGTRKRNREAQRDLNDRNSRKECERRINANFTDRDIWATFTYSEDQKPGSWEEAQKNMQAFIRRVNYRRKKMGLQAARYVYVTEVSGKGRWHHHIVTDGDLPMDVLEGLWTKGERNELRRLERDENGLSGMAHYMTKQSNGKKRWTASKGLKMPEIKVTHYKCTSSDVQRIARDFGQMEVKCRELYGEAGYIWTSGQARMNTVNGFFYLYGRMRLPKGRRKHEQGGIDGKAHEGAGGKMDGKRRGTDLRRTVHAGSGQKGKARGRKAER